MAGTEVTVGTEVTAGMAVVTGGTSVVVTWAMSVDTEDI